jgi:hypothetical protein
MHRSFQVHCKDWFASCDERRKSKKGIGHRQIGDVRTTGVPRTFAQFEAGMPFPFWNTAQFDTNWRCRSFWRARIIGIPSAPIALCDVFSPSQRKINLPSAGLEIHKSYDESSSRG